MFITAENVYIKIDEDDERVQMHWLQPGGQTVGDQLFGPFARKDVQRIHTTSWKEKPFSNSRQSTIVYLTVCITMVGFILQFIGLRAMHSSVAMAQLGATLLMATIRACLRMNRSGQNSLVSEGNILGYELDWLAMEIESCKAWDLDGDDHQVPQPAQDGTVVVRPGSAVVWGIISREPQPDLSRTETYRIANLQSEQREHSGQSEECAEPPRSELITRNYQFTVPKPNLAVRVMKVRARLARLTPDWDLPTRKYAHILQTAIENVMNVFYNGETTLKPDWGDASTFFWALSAHTKDTPVEPVFLYLRRSYNHEINTWTPWKANASEIEAVLGLWLWSEKCRRPTKRLVAQETDEAKVDYRMWIYRETQFDVDEVLPAAEDRRQFSGWQAVGLRREGPLMPLSVLSVKVDSNTPPTSAIYAQDVFASFMSAVTNIIESVGGSTKRRQNNATMEGGVEHAAVEGFEQFRLFNTQLNNVAMAFHSCGLGSVEEAYMCLIPPLRAKFKLPPTREAHEDARLAAMSSAKTSHWTDAAELLLWIYNSCSKSHPAGLGKAESDLARLCLRILLEGITDAQNLAFGAIERLLTEPNLISANLRGSAGFALQKAASGGHLDVVNRLLKAKAEVNAAAARDGGRTALQAAAEGGHLNVVDRLLEANAEVNAAAARDGGRTALQAAAEGGHLEVVDRLLAVNADVNAAAAMRDGRTALQEAEDGGHLEVVDRLKSALSAAATHAAPPL
ncbi:hypothetical protein GP486_007689 [Trichoglossum hirsutum]|uniref:Ankyrin repeat protein n=1 Tax=Trichoglossum hirsutum TaxID=265104 RepID=A0A9P8L7J3_9PEZI|nr:hypothetical protein GP486_007689 [Trichoglossum hirsutum]